MVTFSDDISAKSSLYVERFRYLKNSLCVINKALLYEKESPDIAEGLNSICVYVARKKPVSSKKSTLHNTEESSHKMYPLLYIV